MKPRFFRLYVSAGSTQAICLGESNFASVPRENSSNRLFILKVPEGAKRWPDTMSIIGVGRVLVSETMASRLVDAGVRGGCFLPVVVHRVEGGTRELRQSSSPPTYYLAMAEGEVEIDVSAMNDQRRSIPVRATNEDRSDVFNVKYRSDGVVHWGGFVGNIRLLEALRGFDGHNVEVRPLDFGDRDGRKDNFKINLRSKKWPPQWYPDWFTPHPNNLVEG